MADPLEFIRSLKSQFRRGAEEDIKVQEMGGLRDPEDTGVFLKDVPLDPEIREKVNTILLRQYAFHKFEDPDTNLSADEQDDVLFNVRAYRNVRPEGGYVFMVPVFQDDGTYIPFDVAIPLRGEDFIQ